MVGLVVAILAWVSLKADTHKTRTTSIALIRDTELMMGQSCFFDAVLIVQNGTALTPAVSGEV